MSRYVIGLSLVFSCLTSSAARAGDSCRIERQDERVPFSARFDIMITGVNDLDQAQVAVEWGYNVEDVAAYRSRMVARLRARRESGALADTRDDWLDTLTSTAAVVGAEGVLGNTQPGFYHALIWRRMFGSPRVSGSEIARQFNFSNAHVRQKLKYLQRAMNQRVRTYLRRMNSVERVYDEVLHVPLTKLAPVLISTAPSRTGDLASFPRALRTWLNARIQRAFDETSASATRESYAQERRFNTLVLAVQLGVARAVNRVPSAQHEWAFRVVKNEILAGDPAHAQLVQWTPGNLTFAEGRDLRWQLSRSILAETLAVLEVLER